MTTQEKTTHKSLSCKAPDLTKMKISFLTFVLLSEALLQKLDGSSAITLNRQGRERTTIDLNGFLQDTNNCCWVNFVMDSDQKIDFEYGNNGKTPIVISTSKQKVFSGKYVKSRINIFSVQLLLLFTERCKETSLDPKLADNLTTKLNNFTHNSGRETKFNLFFTTSNHFDPSRFFFSFTAVTILHPKYVGNTCIS